MPVVIRIDQLSREPHEETKHCRACSALPYLLQIGVGGTRMLAHSGYAVWCSLSPIAEL